MTSSTKIMIKDSEKLTELLKLFGEKLDWSPYMARVGYATGITIQGDYNEKVRKYLSSEKCYRKINSDRDDGLVRFQDDENGVRIILDTQ